MSMPLVPLVTLECLLPLGSVVEAEIHALVTRAHAADHKAPENEGWYVNQAGLMSTNGPHLYANSDAAHHPIIYSPTFGHILQRLPQLRVCDIKAVCRWDKEKERFVAFDKMYFVIDGIEGFVSQTAQSVEAVWRESGKPDACIFATSSWNKAVMYNSPQHRKT
ncbi:hypothetical protein B0H19DRAFT_1266760 [Mycena capillaripes]|nr:hypothetical protein B0H19DRAFT_1266760 [Mycena capillaripes]